MRRAPSLAGIHGSERTLLGGDTVLADDEYLRESILDPSEKVVGGYQPIMPAYRGQISEEELMRLITLHEDHEGRSGRDARRRNGERDRRHQGRGVTR